MAQGSLKELETHLLLSVRPKIRLTDIQLTIPILKQCESVGKLFRALIRFLENNGSRE
ncbi:hypothetical protein LC609_16265 [Nostoc sp. XA013]|nr:hypothetical protein [Nostoc sp. XA013]